MVVQAPEASSTTSFLDRRESGVLHFVKYHGLGNDFNSTKKRGGVAVRGKNESKVHVHWKGSAEIILASCFQYIDVDSSLQSIDEQKSVLRDAIDNMAARSLRCVAIAYRTCEANEVPTDQEQLAQWDLPDDDLVLVAIVESYIYIDHNYSLTCVYRANVMGRSYPTDKLLLVQTLRKQGEVVAVTGNGTNDAPALHEADIGLSMGIQGTEDAKESSDIIILDDNFASVVKFQLTVNVAALTINVVAAISSGDVPLNTVQRATRNKYHVEELAYTVLLVLNFAGMRILDLDSNQIEHSTMVKNTVVFNTFVLCQIFNEVNARKPEEPNVFTGVTKKPLVTGIVGSSKEYRKPERAPPACPIKPPASKIGTDVSDWFEQYRERIIEAEQLILTTLNFELGVQHPYESLTSTLQKLGYSQSVLVNLALSLISEG
ncbi:calcium-transporting ATPase 10 plasma membrane-type [Phtheirospermum japonicum]|uniref:Calcium-transporting ATPase 10 plasma membrane-type n=1 Tax=Phtheirospermum japonicum TaxID=374723 RepID=A0A830CCJ8_9LAMI|nr:calcium-transporting ATPase 10 plasma membrane-type [Phtheirospermum japonicum]